MRKMMFAVSLMITLVPFGAFSQETSISVGIVDFHADKKSEGAAKEAVAALSSNMGQYRFVNLVERSKLGAIMKEIELSQAGVIDEKEAIRIGKISGVRVLIDGSVSAKGVFARAIYAETGKIIAVSSAAEYGVMAKELVRGIEVFLAKENLRGLRNESSAINTEFWATLPGGSYRAGTEGKARVGNTVSFHFKADTDGYLSIIDIQPSGDIVLLYPNDYSKDNAVRAGVEYSIPSKNDDFELTLTEPSGTDTLVVYFTKRKVDWLSREKLTGDGFKTVKDGEKFAASRAVTVQSRQLRKDEWESLELIINVAN